MANGHKALAASKTKQWRFCPGSLALFEAFTFLQKPSGRYAQLGTSAHALLEACMRNQEEPEDYHGRIIVIKEKDDGGEYAEIQKKNAKAPKNPTIVWFEVDQDMIDAMTVATDYIRARCEELGVDEKDLILESKVNPLPERDDTGGSADIILDSWPEMLEVIDYKNGSGVYVPVENNDQVLSYLLGAAEETGFSHELYRGTLIQPRHMDGRVPQWMEYTAEELMAYQNILRKDAKRVDLARSKIKKGKPIKEMMDLLYKEKLLSVGCDGSHCTFCELKALTTKENGVIVCPAVENKAKDLLQVDFADDPEDTEMDIPSEDKKLFDALTWVPFLDKWAKEVKAQSERRLVQRLQAGEDGMGFKFIYGKSSRSFKETLSEAAIVKKLVSVFKLKKEDVYTKPELMSGPQLEKLIQKDLREKFNEDILTKSKGKLTMVPESKKGEAIIPPSVGDDFDDIENEELGEI
jgi:hypothetical protein